MDSSEMDLTSEWPPDPTNTVSDNGGKSLISSERYIWIFTLPLIFVIGVTGNILTMFVMQKKRMRGTATSVYLTLLGGADTAVLVFGLIPEWLIQTGIKNIPKLHKWVCKFERFSFYSVGDIAVWILVAFTCDRCIAVCFPLKKREMCTKKRAYVACLVITIIAVVKNLHTFWTRGIVFENGNVTEYCGKPEPFAYFEMLIRPWIVMVLVSLGPFIVIVVCNVMIIKELVASMRMHSSSPSARQNVFTQTTVMCLSTSLAFLILITPSIVLLIGKPYWTSDDTPNEAYDIAKAVNNQLMYLNHSINFFLYCLTGARFRDELVDMFKRTETEGKPLNGNKHVQYSMNSQFPSARLKTETVDTPELVRPGRSRFSRNLKNARDDMDDDKETDPIINESST